MRKRARDVEGVEREEVQLEVHLHFLHFLDLCMPNRPGRLQVRLPRQLPRWVRSASLPYTKLLEVGRSRSPQQGGT